MRKVCECRGKRIVIDVTEPGCGTIVESNLRGDRVAATADDAELDEAVDITLFNTAVDALESCILALACEGVDITTPAFGRAVLTTLDACENHLED